MVKLRGNRGGNPVQEERVVQSLSVSIVDQLFQWRFYTWENILIDV